MIDHSEEKLEDAMGINEPLILHMALMEYAKHFYSDPMHQSEALEACIAVAQTPEELAYLSYCVAVGSFTFRQEIEFNNPNQN